MILFSHGHQEARWKGRIENEDGYKIIKNPNQPMFGEVVFDLEKVNVLGEEKNENDIFALIWEVQADAQGNVYVSDIKDRRIKKFSSEGEYLDDIGQIGQGPGEFQSARNIYVDDKTGDFYVSDFMKVHQYNQNGVFQKTVSINRIFHTFFVDIDQSFWARTSYMDETGQGEAFEKISPQGKLAKRIHKFSPQALGSTKPSGEGEVTAVAGPKHGYEQELIVSRIDEKTFLWALSYEYEMNVVDIEGNLLFKVQKQEFPEGFSGKEKDEYVYDIFSKSGYFLYQSRFSEDPVVIKNGLFYTVIRDPETDIQHVKIYRIKNWSLIKKDISY